MIIEINGDKIDVTGMSRSELISRGLSSSEADVIYRMAKMGNREPVTA
jgi:hypothetical protein